jgi:hypothetical protein
VEEVPNIRRDVPDVSQEASEMFKMCHRHVDLETHSSGVGCPLVSSSAPKVQFGLV